MNVTDKFVDNIFSMGESDFSEESLQEAKKCLLDYLAVTYAGAFESKTKSLKALILMDSAGDMPVIGLSHKTNIHNAILFNGIHSHIIELDDGHRFGMLHPGAPIISALLPVMVQKQIAGSFILKAIVLGYEVAIRLACAMQPSLKLRGFHATGITGIIGAAVAVAYVLGGTKQQLKDAISAAATSASGILRVIRDVSELKPYNVGNAALSGYNSAILGLAGFKGPHEIFDDDLGFLQLFSEDPQKNLLVNSFLGEPMICGIYRKPYAACRHCHSPIEAGLLLKNKNCFKIEDIKNVVVETYSLGVKGHDHIIIESINSAKMSTPYSLAVALIKNTASILEYSKSSIVDNEVLELTKKISVVANDKLSELVPEKRAAIVTIELLNGEKLTEEVYYPKGEPENPITEEELDAKFLSLLEYADVKEEKIKSILNSIYQFEHKNLELSNYF